MIPSAFKQRFGKPHLSAIALAALLVACAHPNAPAAANPNPDSNLCWTTLGTVGGPLPVHTRGQPANLLSVDGAQYFVDVGDGAFSALADVGVSPRAIRGVFISHLHFDHTSGLSAVLGLRNAMRITSPLVIYGPPGTRAMVDGLVAAMEPTTSAGYGIPGEAIVPGDINLSVVELRGGEAPLELGALRVTTIANSHYSFTPGSVESSRFASLSYRFEAHDWSVAYTGDTGPSADVAVLARDVDLLVSEMMDFDATIANIARSAPGIDPASLQNATRHLAAHHLTPEQVAALAAEARARQLVVTHLIPGNQDETQVRSYLQTIARTYAGPARVANDGDRFCAD